ncbi:MAG: biotin/lipoyl-containing protein [Ilumatobacteraceae bacterium]
MPIVAVAVASTSVIGLLVGLVLTNEGWRLPASTAGLWMLGLMGRTKETSDGRFQRGRIMGYLEANPGCHFRALMNALDLSNGQAAHHLRVLEREERLWRRQDGRLVRLYPLMPGMHPETPDEDLPVPPLSPDPNSLQGRILALLDDDDFAEARVDTGLLARSPSIIAGSRPGGSDLEAHLLAVVATMESANRAADHHWSTVPSGWRNLRTRGQRVALIEDGGAEAVEHAVEYEVVAVSGREDHWSVRLGPWPEPDEAGALAEDERPVRSVRRVMRSRDDGAVVDIEVDGLARSVSVRRAGTVFVATDASGRTRWTARPRFTDHESEMVGSGPVAPLPGTVIAVSVTAGQTVAADEVLMVVEAMKMEHQITAPAAGLVAEVRFAVGDRVDMGDLLVLLDTGDGS